MFGRSNNVTFSTRNSGTATLGKRLHLHRHLPHSSSATGCRSPTSKLCDLRKSNSFSDNFTTRPHQHVAIATQVISPSAIGQSWHQGRIGGTRLITDGFGGGRRPTRDEEDDDDQNSLIIGRRRRWCTWGKLGCVGTTIAAGIITMTVIILAVGYMQSEKERVFRKPVTLKLTPRGEGKTLLHQYRALFDQWEPTATTPTSHASIATSSQPLDDNDTGQRYVPLPDLSVTTYRPSRPHVNNGNDSVLNSSTNARPKHAEGDSDSLNEISNLTQKQKTNNGLHQRERDHEQEQLIGGTGEEQFEYSDSPPSEVKVLPPKDFVFNPDSTAAENIVQQPNNDNTHGDGNNGLSFTIPIYTAGGTGASSADITRDMLNSFTSSSSTTAAPSLATAASVVNDELISKDGDGTTMETAAAAASTESSSTASSDRFPPSSSAAPAPADYANPFNYEPAPIQILNTKVEHSNDVPVVAKLQTELFDDYEDENEVNQEDEHEHRHGPGGWPQQHHRYGQGQGHEYAVTVRDNIHVYDPKEENMRPVFGNRVHAYHNGYGREPPKVRIHDRMYTPKPGSVVIIEPIEYPAEVKTQSSRPHSQEHDDDHHDHNQNADEQSHAHADVDDLDRSHLEIPLTSSPTAPTKHSRPQQPSTLRPRPRPNPTHPSNFHPTQRTRPVPVKTTSTSSSFSKLYEFQNENGNNDAARANINSKVEYIQVDKNQNNNFDNFVPSPQLPSSVQAEYREFIPSTALPTPPDATTISPAINSYMIHLNSYPPPYSPQRQATHSEAPTGREVNNPLLSPEVNRFLSNLNANVNAHSTANAILAPMGMSVSLAPAPGPTSHASNYGIATNSHLAELSNFDNFDFSQFLTKTPEPTAANNYGGATTPVADTTDMHLTKRTFYLSGLDPMTVTASSVAAANNPYAFLFTGNTALPAPPTQFGSPTATGAGLSVYHPSNTATNYYGQDKLPSGTIPLDLASSYMSVLPSASMPFASSTAYGAPQGTQSVSLINYNDPTLALANYYPTASSGGTSSQGHGPGNYNTITQGIHLLSLLSGNIPQHLLQDQMHSSASSISERSQRPQHQRYESAQSRGIDSPSSSLLSSLIPDQLGSFSQNIVTKMNAIKKQVMKKVAAAKAKNATTSMADILGIAEPQLTAEELQSSLVKKDGAKNYDGGTDSKIAKKLNAGLKSGFYT